MPSLTRKPINNTIYNVSGRLLTSPCSTVTVIEQETFQEAVRIRTIVISSEFKQDLQIAFS